MRFPFHSRSAGRRRRYRGSALLASAGWRLARMLVVVAMLWMLSSWALGWWGT
ncbi:MAG TPA: hypothetical protein VK104_08995 [Burkholderiaceae bacterium]|nr:hypothetical protein [Burkholderiaceae bacterium]